MMEVVVDLNYVIFEILMEKREFSVHPYSSVNLKRQDIQEIIYDTIELPWGQLDNYTLSHKVGRGRYSHVFQGTNIKNKQIVVLKILLPIKPSKIKREYHITKQLNHPNIIGLVDIVRCPHLRTATLVFEHFPHEDFRSLYPKLTLPDIRHYSRQLLQVIFE